MRPKQVIRPRPTSIGQESILLPWKQKEEEGVEYLLNYNLINHKNVTYILHIRKLRSLAPSTELGVESSSIFFQSSYSFISFDTLPVIEEKIQGNTGTEMTCSNGLKGQVYKLIPTNA